MHFQALKIILTVLTFNFGLCSAAPTYPQNQVTETKHVNGIYEAHCGGATHKADAIRRAMELVKFWQDLLEIGDDIEMFNYYPRPEENLPPQPYYKGLLASYDPKVTKRDMVIFTAHNFVVKVVSEIGDPIPPPGSEHAHTYFVDCELNRTPVMSSMWG